MAGASKQTLDFTNVKDGGQFNKKHVPEGDYPAKITKVQDVVSKKDNAPMWLYTIEVKTKAGVGTYPYYCKMTPEQLWKLRALFGACGIVIPKKRVAIDPNRIVGKSIGVTLQDTEYEGKIQSEVQYAIPLSEVTEGDATDDEVEEEETEDEETEEDEDTSDDEEEEDEEEEEEPAPAPKKRAVKKAAPAPAKPAAKKKRQVKDEDLDELDVDDL